MPPKSPSAPIKVAKPRQQQHNTAQANNPNLNPFAPLSPEEHPELILAYNQSLHDKPLKVYTPHQLLVIASRLGNKGCRVPPPEMTPLESWYGSIKTAHPPADDPAIAAMGPPTGGNNRRGGGFGEGFGFGGGIGGGRGLSRGGGTRNIGLRRQQYDNHDAASHQQGPQHNTRQNRQGNRQGTGTGEEADGRMGQRDKGKREDEWRRDKPSYRQAEQLDSSPAWMDDAEVDPAIASMDTFVQFQPGVDMIAKHKQAMKDRERDGRWSDRVAPEPVKPKVFNSADYLLPNKAAVETPLAQSSPTPPEEPPKASTSRFQRFFSPEPAPWAPSPENQPPRSSFSPPGMAAPPEQHHPPPMIAPQPERNDGAGGGVNQASRLMEMLSFSRPESHSPVRPPVSSPPYHQQYQHVSPPPDPSAHPSYEQHYSRPPQPPSAPNLLQLLQRGQAPSAPQISPHPSSAPIHSPGAYGHFGPPPPQSGMWPPQQIPPPTQPPPGHYGGYHNQMPPNMPHQVPSYARPPDPRQQDILNNLFANLGPRQ